MKELREILNAVEKSKRQDVVAALATIVKAKGSTYRRPGARMFLSIQGEMVGSISGGCLEGDVFEHAKKVMNSGIPVVVQYDTSSDDDLVWGLGLGCAGVVDVLIEPLRPDSDYFSFLTHCVEADCPGVLATVFRVAGLNARIGSRLALREDGTRAAAMENRELEAAILPDATAALHSRRSSVKEYTLPEGTAEVFIESIQPAVPLLLFGAGHDTIPVVRLAKEIGWNVTVVDSRPAFARKERFPGAYEIVLSNPEDVAGKVRVAPHAVAVIMTHNYAQDLKLLKAMLPSSVRYLSVLGPKKRTESLLSDLSKEGFVPSEEQLSRLYSPAGIDLGAETPEEIALSILGEIQAVLAGRSAGLLRNRKGPIH
ncbi:MAG TPA: XdhC/CoxI family protein, partial [Acidobacteriota bacterium]|nr:XdhC/CoxI family protein [Acidobacteriota bacterium]